MGGLVELFFLRTLWILFHYLFISAVAVGKSLISVDYIPL